MGHEWVLYNAAAAAANLMLASFLRLSTYPHIHYLYSMYRFVKCHGYDGYICVKNSLCGVKSLGEHAILWNWASFGKICTTDGRFLCID